MSDFETRLSEALTSGAERAPEAARLVSAARTRAKARRRTRIALVAVGAVVALAVPVSVMAITADGGGDAKPDDNGFATDPSEEHSYDAQSDPYGSHTIEYDGVAVDIPNKWVELDTSSCEIESVRWAPFNVDPCEYDGPGLAFYASATFDAATGAGVITFDGEMEPVASGYVYEGDWAIYVQSDGPMQARQILGSVREPGVAAPDVWGWRTESFNGLSVDVPASWKRGALSNWCLDESVDGWVEGPQTGAREIRCGGAIFGYGIRFGGPDFRPEPGVRPSGPPEYPEGAWAGYLLSEDESRYVFVVTPTQAIADLMAGSLRAE